MHEFKIVRGSRLTRRASHELIQAFARYGNHYQLENFRSEAHVKRAFAINGIEYDKLVEQCRNPGNNVPFFRKPHREHVDSFAWCYGVQSEPEHR